jgi:hypothetical protein
LFKECETYEKIGEDLLKPVVDLLKPVVDLLKPVVDLLKLG